MVRAAVDLYRRNGMQRTGFSDVLSAAGAARGAIYHHFPGGKEELAAEVVAANGNDVIAFFRRLLERDRPAVALGKFVEWYSERLEASEMSFGCPMAPTVLEAGLESDLIAAAATQAFDGWQEVVAEALRRHSVPPARADQISQTVVAAIEGALILARAHRSVTPLQVVGKELAQLLDHATKVN
jgi:TetR/AcrR family transcriptional repressor of lmrAB and yxaGH operons